MAPQEITPVGKGPLADLLRKTYTTIFRSDYIRVGGVLLPVEYKEVSDSIEDFGVREDDVWVCSFPKSGTTWTQEMVWCIAEDLDFERAKVPLPDRFPWLESSGLFSMNEVSRQYPQIEVPEDVRDRVAHVDTIPSPRFIKAHLPASLLPRQIRDGEKKPKIIYVVRNPKDTCISFFHYARLAEGFHGTFEEFATLFLGDTIQYGPYWEHVLGYWNKRNEKNVLFLKYEDMKKNLPSVIQKTATFLGKNLTNDQVSSLNEHLSFSNMKTNPSVNYEEVVSRIQQVMQIQQEGTFMRTGKTEQWKTEMTPELIKRFDDWTVQNLKGTELSF